MKTFFAPGKVMLCGEYTVLAGLECMSLPTSQGQWMKVWEMPNTGNGKLVWQSKEADGSVWFDAKVDSDIMHISECSDEETGKTLLHLLREVASKRPDFFHHKTFRIETECEFNRTWGLGSSSTLVSLVSQWSGVDAFDLQTSVFGGSGYDIAVALLRKPVIYWLEAEIPNWAPWKLDAELTSEWTVVFTGKKQDSRKSLSEVREKIDTLGKDPMLRGQLDMILRSFHEPKSVMMLEAGLEMWQALISNILGLTTPYQDLGFSPQKGGLCKWLGAWGGDMLLVNKKILETQRTTFDGMEQMPWNNLVMQ